MQQVEMSEVKIKKKHCWKEKSPLRRQILTRDIVGEKSHLQEERSRRIQSRRPPEGGAAASWRKSKLQPRKFHKKLLEKEILT